MLRPRPMAQSAVEGSESVAPTIRPRQHVLALVDADAAPGLRQRLATQAPELHLDLVHSPQALCEGVRSDDGIKVIVLDWPLTTAEAQVLLQRLLAVRADLPPLLICGERAVLRNLEARLAGIESVVFDTMHSPLRAARAARQIQRLIAAGEGLRERRELRERVMRLQFERDALRTELDAQSTHDAESGLINRRTFVRHLASLAPAGEPSPAALAVISVDRYRQLVTGLGDAESARVLNEVGALVRQHFPAQAIAARIGLNEFAVAHPDLQVRELAMQAEPLRLAISNLAGRYPEITISASVGVAVWSDDARADNGLLDAHRAAFVARQRGGNLVHAYRDDDPELVEQREDTLWATRIRNALAQGRFRLVFQPVMRIADQRIDHYEVLVRMLDERGHLLPPPAFIAVAERTGLIHDIDRWVIGAAIGLLEHLLPLRPDLRFNINLSGRAFQDSLLVPFVCQQLEKSRVAGNRITFEITETAAIANIGETREMVAALRTLGCEFALDDFGAGFASYSYLKQLQVDVVKIDGAFIRNVATDQTDQILVRSMVDIAKRLGKRTVAEFVGDQQTLDFLAGIGVDYAQGYFVGKPGALLQSTA